MSPSIRRTTAPFALAATAVLLLAGCAEGGGDDANATEGQTVKIAGAINGVEADLLNQSFEKFTADTGITVEYSGDKSFEGNIVTKVAGGSAPDIAIVPQPGLLQSLIETGDVVEGSSAVESNVDEYWSEDWKGYGSVDGTFYAAPMLANVKGYVWYSPAKFAEWGVEVPTTWDETLALTKTIRDKTGVAPWCAGFNSGDASGWAGTDWIEDLVLRQSGPETYDDWVAGDVPFTDPQIKEAFDAVGEILLNPDYVNAGFGGVTSINSTTNGDAAAKVADGSCALSHQATFFTSYLLTTKTAAGTEPVVAPDGDIYGFILPGITEGESLVEAGGEFVAAFSDSAATQKVVEYMSTPEWADERVKLGGVISANKGSDASLASSEILVDAMTTLQDDATTIRFDASDMMPAVVGSGSFWKGIVSWIDGRDTETVLSDIEAGREN
ncbi:extracellular solute-binding protein [Microbacteriaceae bacterium VKM Ac-2854]|nr:extracellular solute-binding protein [Microbacteriaceae bacterium VKM Ac-2854]